MLLYLKELLVSNVTVAKTVLFRPQDVRPAFIEFTTRLRRDASILMLGNLVSMTPGTLTVDFDPKTRVFTIHVLDAEDPAEIQKALRTTFEERIARFMEPHSLVSEDLVTGDAA